MKIRLTQPASWSLGLAELGNYQFFYWAESLSHYLQRLLSHISMGQLAVCTSMWCWIKLSFNRRKLFFLLSLTKQNLKYGLHKNRSIVIVICSILSMMSLKIIPLNETIGYLLFVLISWILNWIVCFFFFQGTLNNVRNKSLASNNRT